MSLSTSRAYLSLCKEGIKNTLPSYIRLINLVHSPRCKTMKKHFNEFKLEEDDQYLQMATTHLPGYWLTMIFSPYVLFSAHHKSVDLI
jgi:hypothetical protein